MRSWVAALIGAWAGAMLVGTVLGWIWFMNFVSADYEAEEELPGRGWIVAYVAATLAAGFVGGLLGYAAARKARERASV